MVLSYDLWQDLGSENKPSSPSLVVSARFNDAYQRHSAQPNSFQGWAADLVQPRGAIESTNKRGHSAPCRLLRGTDSQSDSWRDGRSNESVEIPQELKVTAVDNYKLTTRTTQGN